MLHHTPGWRITGCDGKENRTFTKDADGNTVLTISDIHFSTAVRLQAEREYVTFVYRDAASENALVREVPVSHLALNTLQASEAFVREGYVLIGWNTAPDGSGKEIGLGSRVRAEDFLETEERREAADGAADGWKTHVPDENGGSVLPAKAYSLYAMWAKEAPEEDFETEPVGNGLRITGYRKTDIQNSAGDSESKTETQILDGHSGTEPDILAIPREIGGLPVYSIAGGALAGCRAGTVILPPGLKNVEKGAFERAALHTLYLFDDLQTVSAHAFDGCENLQTLRVQAATAPVYSGNYFATFADKMDYLKSVRDRKKLVLFSGSSTRFGYDCDLLKKEFPEYEPVNMGVFAYTNALPQYNLILSYMNEGDILLASPEFDAPQSQFCISNQMEWHHFAMAEANYDLLAELNLREYASVFAALDEYLQVRAGMDGKEYTISPSEYDEEGNPVHTPSYNRYGDYILYRENAKTDQPVYGLPVDYTAQALPKSTFLDPFNAVIARYQEKGIHFLVTYAPRNEKALSERSSRKTRAELDQHLRDNLIAPVISDIEESMYSGYYLYGTDNHLSTEGVKIRTERIVEDLRRFLETQ
ncbi:MAG: hypothetical protein IJ773_01575 [Lachnospiraceae bacterium]|nr:hypothetical protein [Lachnospiraceae bacterium]